MINSIIEGDNKMLLEGLKELKEQKKMTNQELADLSGVPLGTINRIMADRRTIPAFRRYVTSHERWEDRWIKSRD